MIKFISKNGPFILVLLISLAFDQAASSEQKRNSFLKSALVQLQTFQAQNITYLDDYAQRFYALGFCDANNCKNPNGKCLSTSICLCNKGYAQLAATTDSKSSSCAYEQKSQTIAFILELIFFFGVGHFYVGQILYGLIKLLYIVLVLILDCVLRRIIFNRFPSAHKSQTFLMFLFYTLYLIIIVWEVVDICLYGMNKIKDGNGVPLDQWGENVIAA
jgi:hypothetical protein